MGGVMVEFGGIRLYENPEHNGWGLAKDGLPDWWDSPDGRGEDDPIPGQDGLFDDPDPQLLDGRRVTVRGFFRASTMAWLRSEGKTALNALIRSSDLGFRVFDGEVWQSIRRARIRGRIRQLERRRGDSPVLEFELTVLSPDPLKYGPMRQITLDAQQQVGGGLVYPIVDGALDYGVAGPVAFPGLFSITNMGSAAFIPERFTIVGPVAGGFTIVSDTYVIQYTGPIGRGQRLVLSPFAGGRAALDGVDQSHLLTRADWAPVEPAETRSYLFTPISPGPGSQLIIDHPEGAYI